MVFFFFNFSALAAAYAPGGCEIYPYFSSLFSPFCATNTMSTSNAPMCIINARVQFLSSQTTNRCLSGIMATIKTTSLDTRTYLRGRPTFFSRENLQKNHGNPWEIGNENLKNDA